MNGCILVVDDAATVRLYYRHVLSGLGYRVEEAWNGAEALEKALLAPPALMLVDVNMPHLDGYGLIQAMRRAPELRHVPAVMISTESTERDAELAFAAGANLYLSKPVRPERLGCLARVLVGAPGA